MISALILTYNEENILQRCIDSLDFVDELIIFDSFSTDSTEKIARKNNANFKQRKFDNFAAQRNAGLKSINPKSDWILMVDADEIITMELKNELLQSVKLNSDISLFKVRRKDMFMGKWIKHSSGYPTWFPRFFKNHRVTVEREINEEYITTGKTKNLKNHLIHYPFNKGLQYWFTKHNIYSDLEASKMISEMKEKINITDLFSKDPSTRRKTYKRMSYKFPFRPTIVFLIFYIVNGGFMDGKEGYEFCRLRKIYESMIDIKLNSVKKSI